jgi:hypothetical protein
MRRSAILLLNHAADRSLFDFCARLRAETSSAYDVFLLSDRTRRSVSLGTAPPNTGERVFTLDDLVSLGYPGKQDIAEPGKKERSLRLGNAELPVLLFHREHPGYDFYWVVEYDVRYSGSWGTFFAAFESSHADLLGTSLIRHSEFPGWSHWHSLRLTTKDAADAEPLRGFFPVYRVSRRALECLHDVYLGGCAGHMETLMPTVLHRAGLELEDIGGDGEFVKPENRNRFYTNDPRTNDLSPGTFVYRPVHAAIGPDPGKLWHPVKPVRAPVVNFVNRVLRKLS